MNKFIIFVLFFLSALSTTFASSNDRHDVSTITNCIHDIFFKVDRAFMEANALQTDGTNLVDAEEAKRLYDLAQKAGYTEVHSEAGGSTGNSVVTLRNLGFDVSLMGTLADDSLGELYKASLERNGVKFRSAPSQQNHLGSGTCTIFISENDSGGFDRAMYTSLGVSGDIRLSPKDIDEASKARCLLVEGYSFNTSTTYDSVRRVAEKTIANANLVGLTLSADFCVSCFGSEISSFINNFASIVIGNESEAKILTGTTDALSSVKIFREQGKRGAVTCGSKGAYVFDATGIYEIKSPYVDVVLDPTGAGDVFAAGLIYGLLEGKSIIESGQIAALCAGEVIKVYGGHTAASLADLVNSGAVLSIAHSKIED